MAHVCRGQKDGLPCGYSIVSYEKWSIEIDDKHHED
jgi:hypothetical protein